MTEITSNYKTKENDVKVYTFKIGGVIVVYNTISSNRFGDRSERQEIEMGYITKFVKDKDNLWSSFMMRVDIIDGNDQKSIRPSYYRVKRVYFQDSGIYYTPKRMTPLEGKIEDYPEYFL